MNIKGAIIFLVAILILLGGVSAQSEEKGIKGGKPQSSKEPDRQICITFDDLPVVRVEDRMDRMMITDQIIYHLGEYKVPSTGFVVGNNIIDDYDLLELWLKNGHTLGNHTYSHPDLNSIPTELFIPDIARGEEAIEGVLIAFNQKKRFFRYPFLHYGATFDVKKKVRDYLDNTEYIIAPVSVDTDDFVYNLQFEKMYALADSINIIRLSNEYLDHVLQQIVAAEELSDKLLGRQIKHILLLHANRLHSHILGELLLEIANLGYRFISIDEALKDPVYGIEDSYLGIKGLSHLQKLERTNPDLMPAKEGKK